MNKKTKKLFIIIISLILLTVLVFLVFSNKPKATFSVSDLDVEKIYSRIETITSYPYFGRQTGSTENEAVMEYIENEFMSLGVEPAGDNNTYYQPFSTVIADIDKHPMFIITDNNGEEKEFVLYQDYNLFSSMNAGGIDFCGELLLVKDKLFSTNAEMIKDRVVIIEAEELNSSHIDYVIEKGGQGIFCCVDYQNEGKLKRYEQEKDLNISGKTGESIAAGYISLGTYEYLLASQNETVTGQASIISKAAIKADINYTVVETANILGKIEGSTDSSEVLVITANIDGAGWGSDSEYFGGALRSASGISVLLEVAGVIAGQDSPPDKTILFIGLNGQEQNFSGAKYYANNPVFDFSSSIVIHLEAVGVETKSGLLVAPDKKVNIELRDAVIECSESSGLHVSKSFVQDCAVSAFSEKGAAAVRLSDVNSTQNKYDDTIESISTDYLENTSMALLGFVKETAFPGSVDNLPNIWGSIAAIFEKPVDFFKNIFNSGTDTIDSVSSYSSVIRSSVLESLKLLISSILLSFIIGIASGLLSGYRAKRKNLRALGSIISFSIPDVLIILMGWTICIFYGINFPQLSETIPIQEFLMPLITITILPTVYISRITFIVVQEELEKDYLRNSKAKGFSRRRIVFSELMPAAVLKIIDTLPTIMTMLISNLIVVEYLYNYMGAAYYLIYFYNKQAYFGFIVLVLAFAAIYILFSFVIQLIAKSVNPVKQEVRR